MGTAFLVGGLLAAAIAALARRAHALTREGAAAAFVVGTCTFGAGGVPAAATLLAFFVSSLALTRLGRARKRRLVDIGKGGPRDALQVLANGGVATACILAALGGDATWKVAFAGAYAAATADTWGTEIGTLVRTLPRSIFSRRAIGTGLSGGITPAGTLAEIVGALFVAAVAAACGIAAGPRAALAVALAGIAGAFADSALGATLQDLRFCPRCERTCETNPHACGAPTRHVRGLTWLTNDGVNLLATAAGAAVAYALAR